MPQKNSWSFLVDENTSRTLASALQSVGFVAEHVYDAGLKGHIDADIYSYAQTHKQTIITIDLDFSNIIEYPPPHCGIIVLRLPNNIPTADLIEEVQNGLKTLEGQDLANGLFIIELGRVRVRRP